MEWYIEVLKKYAVFSGRARRKEYWMFVLVNLIIGIGLGLLGQLFSALNILSTIYGLAVLIPGIAVSIRRLHDTARSGWWLLIAFVPLVGVIVLIILMALEGNSGDNQYGLDPKAAVSE